MGETGNHENKVVDAQTGWSPAQIVLDGQLAATLQLFADEASARDHINRHFLTHPECNRWAIVIPGLVQQFGDITQTEERNRVYHHLKRSWEAFQAVYRLLVQSIEANYSDARQLGWSATAYRPRGWVMVFLGTSGVLVVAQAGVIRTVFLPDPDRAVSTCAENPDAQTVGPRRRMRGGHQEIERVAVQRWLRASQWSPEERLYYCVFRPALRFIRSAVYETHPGHGALKPRCNDYYLLKTKVPATQRCTLELWRQWRQQLRGKVYDDVVN